MKLTGKKVLLTGASSGIGYEMAVQLAKENCGLAILARSKGKLEEIAGKHSSEENEILPLGCDVTKKEEVDDAIDKTIEKFGGIDVLILNAGTSSRMDAEDFSSEEGEKIIAVNLTSQLYFLEKIIPHFLEKESGMIVGVSSLAGVRGFPRSGTYSASKAGFTRLLESLRIELRPRGIAVLTVLPGFVKTPMTDKNEFSMPFLMKPGRAAEIIISGIKKEKKLIQFPMPTVLGTKLLAIMPDALFEYFARKHLESLKTNE